MVRNEAAIDDRAAQFQESGISWCSFSEVVDGATACLPGRPKRIATISPSGCSPQARPDIPKARSILQHDLPFNTEVFAKRTMGVNENDLTVSVPKLFFGYATGTNLLFPFAVGGATALFAERSTAEKMFEVIERYRPTILTTVPTMINAMLNVEDANRRDLSSIRFCYSAGEALPVELYHRWKETFGVEICDGIGSAEMFHIYITNRPGRREARQSGTNRRRLPGAASWTQMITKFARAKWVR